MVGGIDNVAQAEALKVQERTERVKEKALLQLIPCSLIVMFIIDLIIANTLFTEDEASLCFNI